MYAKPTLGSQLTQLLQEKHSPYWYLALDLTSCATDLIDSEKHKNYKSTYSSFISCESNRELYELFIQKTMLSTHLVELTRL